MLYSINCLQFYVHTLSFLPCGFNCLGTLHVIVAFLLNIYGLSMHVRDTTNVFISMSLNLQKSWHHVESPVGDIVGVLNSRAWNYNNCFFKLSIFLSGLVWGWHDLNGHYWMVIYFSRVGTLEITSRQTFGYQSGYSFWI